VCVAALLHRVAETPLLVLIVKTALLFKALFWLSMMMEKASLRESCQCGWTHAGLSREG
jgi:hypothetical protein